MSSSVRPIRRASPLQGTVGLVAVCACLLIALLFSPEADLTKIVYPIAVVGVGLWLYATQPPLYLGFTWWIWLITPFARRIIDYQTGGFDPVNPAVLAPLLVTCLTILTFIRFFNRLLERRYFPFFLCLLGVVYGYIVGVAKAGLMPATYALLGWVAPLLFGFHCFLFWKLYPNHRSVVRTTFAWGVLILGVYAIYQYLVAPDWDMQWLEQSGMTSSMGQPEATQFRLFSMLNSTGPFATFMMAGLLLLFDGRGLIPRLALAPGYVSFLLALVRSTWGGWVIGITLILVRSRGYSRSRTVAILAIGAILCIPLIVVSPNTSRISDRADSIANLGQDTSLQERMRLYEEGTLNAILHPIGIGIGSLGTAARLASPEGVEGSAVNAVVFDSGVLAIPLTLGWTGTTLYLGGLIWMIVLALGVSQSNADQFAVISVSIVVALMAMMLFSNQLKGLSGMMAWSFLGLALASRQYHRAHALASA